MENNKTMYLFSSLISYSRDDIECSELAVIREDDVYLYYKNKDGGNGQLLKRSIDQFVPFSPTYDYYTFSDDRNKYKQALVNLLTEEMQTHEEIIKDIAGKIRRIQTM